MIGEFLTSNCLFHPLLIPFLIVFQMNLRHVYLNNAFKVIASKIRQTYVLTIYFETFSNSSSRRRRRHHHSGRVRNNDEDKRVDESPW